MPELTPFAFDPYDLAHIAEPFDTYRRLRDEAPVHYNPDHELWTLSRFADVLGAAQDHKTYTSTKGVTLTYQGVEDAMPTMVFMDPPRHDQLRRLVSRAFTPRRVAALEPYIRKLTGELLDGMLDGSSGTEPMDIIAGLAGPLPAITIAEMYGATVADAKHFKEWADVLIKVSADAAQIEFALDVIADFYAYLTDVIEKRKADPGDDLISGLLAADIDGEHLTHDELLGFSILLLVAGSETTTNLIGNTVAVLAERPDLRAQVAADHSLIPALLDESLRLESPAQGVGRVLTRDVELHGVTIPAGERVFLIFGSGNRDPREFGETADDFDLERGARNLAFGHGVHFCIGASLARLQGRIAFEELLNRLPEWEIVGPTPRIESPLVRGMTSLPIAKV